MNEQTQTWPELAIGLYDKLTGRGAEISYTFEDMSIDIPSGTGNADHARWKLNGTVKITTRDQVNR
jgi:hypothetical protein